MVRVVFDPHHSPRGRGRWFQNNLIQKCKRKMEVVKSRRIFYQLAVGRIVYLGVEIGHFLGTATWALNRLGVSNQVPDFGNYL